jgi:hypothetical protein
MRRFFIIISGVLVLILNQCAPERESEANYFTGTWQAEWYLIDEDMHGIFSESEIIMNGQVVIDQYQTVEIVAYGFEGCVFASDTARNILQFEFQDSVLNLINKEKEVVFSYRVKEKLPEKLTLLLMDDIQLTLSR